jgi:hypothetical protein
MSVEKSIEVAEIEGALATLLTAIDQQRTNVATIDQQYAHRDQPASVSDVDDLINDPVGQRPRCGVSAHESYPQRFEKGIC